MQQQRRTSLSHIQLFVCGGGSRFAQAVNTHLATVDLQNGWPRKRATLTSRRLRLRKSLLRLRRSCIISLPKYLSEAMVMIQTMILGKK